MLENQPLYEATWHFLKLAILFTATPLPLLFPSQGGLKMANEGRKRGDRVWSTEDVRHKVHDKT